MTDGFATQDYWERRLRDHFSLEGVGYLRLGRRFNEWMYRVRGEVFDRVVDEEIGPGAGAGLRVLEVGPGTGFYVKRWLARGAAVTGVDLTDVVVEKLAAAYPKGRFLRADIGLPLEAPLAAESGAFDVVSAFDVLFHIVDDGMYARALANLAGLLKPGGLFLWSDNFVHQPTVRVTHQVSRSLGEITTALERAGFEVVRRVPMFVLMNYPADTTSRLARWGWTAMVSPAMASDWLGGVLGRALYPIERRLVRSRRESPSTELMVCRRRQA
ncbi:MAG: class I SAM-dependent methyltransferase [Gemmatimonadales bacterium]|nr:class I SAM-dependent methyltransferase [Gemmatimonadales bacterium]